MADLSNINFEKTAISANTKIEAGMDLNRESDTS